MKTYDLVLGRGNMRLQGLLLALVVLGVSTSIRAATVRGQLVRVDRNGARHPAAGIEVTVSSGQPKHRSSPAYTNTEGIYYVTNVQPGNDSLEIWIPSQKGPRTYRIHVTEPSTDIKPIVVP